MVDNEPGVLARVVGLFSGRGYNIESLSVSEVDSHKFLSRITVVTSGTKIIVDQIKAQLAKLIPVHKVANFPANKKTLLREMALIKIVSAKTQLVKAKKLCKKFKIKRTLATNTHKKVNINTNKKVEHDHPQKSRT